jgi:hypothetical protein
MKILGLEESQNNNIMNSREEIIFGKIKHVCYKLKRHKRTYMENEFNSY